MNEEAHSGPIEGTVAEVFETPETQSSEPQHTPEAPPTGGQAEPTAPKSGEPEKPSFPTPEQITASVREGLRQSQTPPTTPQKEYTPEELDKLFNVYTPTPEVIQKLLAGGDEALQAFIAIREGLSKQFGTLLQYQLEVARRELTGQMDPALRFVADAAAKADRDDFFSQHSDLKDHELLTQTVFNALKAEGYQAATKEEAFKTLADRTRALLPTAGGNGSGATPSGGARTKTSPTTNRPASLSSGSQAGGGGGSAPQAPFPGAEVFL